MQGFEKELHVALQAVQSAARVCQAVQRRITPDVLEKKDRSPVTIADFTSQAVICQVLATQFPADSVVAEEDSAELRQPENSRFLDAVCAELAAVGAQCTADTACGWIDRGGGAVSSRFWTLDPIDGTKGFVRGEQYAISLALIIDGRIRLAVLGCPNLPLSPGGHADDGSLLFAVRGAGAYLLPIAGAATPSSAQRIKVSSATLSSAARVCESVESAHSSHGRSAEIAKLLAIVQPPVRLDSQAKYAVVARGEAEIYLRLPTKAEYREKIWDHAGGILVVEEAGGRVTDIDGKSIEFTHGRELAANRGVVVTNGTLHDQVLGAIASTSVN